jgi:AraC family transcriptional regulator
MLELRPNASASPSVVRSMRLEHLQFTETVYPAALKMASHTHENAYVSVVLQGAFAETIAGKTRECDSATVTFHPPAEGHAVDFLAPVRILRLDLDSDWLSRVQAFTPLFREPQVVRGGLPSCIAARLYQELKSRDTLSPLAMEGLALELVAESSRQRATPGKRPPAWLLSARDMLHARVGDAPTVAETAAAVGVHPVHLARTFRAHFRVTVGDYVRKLRLEAACAMLASSDYSLAHIALETGFSDQGHFCRAFRQMTGMTPGRYRNTLRKR